MIRAANTMLLSAPVSRVCQHAGSLWRALMAAISGRYRPELHYMRGPGPKWREKQDRAGNNDDKQLNCPSCKVVMVLERVAPKLGPLPELRTYKCLKCGKLVSYEIEQ
jgi:hypothetical protein